VGDRAGPRTSLTASDATTQIVAAVVTADTSWQVVLPQALTVRR